MFQIGILRERDRVHSCQRIEIPLLQNFSSLHIQKVNRAEQYRAQRKEPRRAEVSYRCRFWFHHGTLEWFLHFEQELLLYLIME